jgi:hypothetical protein
MFDIVKIALHRPLTFIVMAILIAIFGVISAVRAPIDMFPEIRIPVIAVAWGYSGLNPQDMTDRIVTPYERALTTTVNDRTHRKPVDGRYRHRENLFPAGYQHRHCQCAGHRHFADLAAPVAARNDAAADPQLQRLDRAHPAIGAVGRGDERTTACSTWARTRSGPARHHSRTCHAVPLGRQDAPGPGRSRPVRASVQGLSAQDVSDAIAAQNQINPAGFVKIGPTQYSVRLNNAPTSIEALNDLPVKVVNGATITMRDVAHVRDGAPPQTNVVHVNARRSVLLTVLKNGATSTLSIIDGSRRACPKSLSAFLICSRSWSSATSRSSCAPPCRGSFAKA